MGDGDVLVAFVRDSLVCREEEIEERRESKPQWIYVSGVGREGEKREEREERERVERREKKV